MSIEQQVIGIIATQALLEPGDITLQSTPEMLGIDSLGLVEAIFAIEETFDVEVPFNANDTDANTFDISTVATICAGVEALIAARAS